MVSWKEAHPLMNRCILSLALFTVGALSHIGWTQAARPPAARGGISQTLRQIADPKGLYVGFFISHYWFLRQGDPNYKSVFPAYSALLNRVAGPEFNLVVMPVFMSATTPKQNQFDWTYSDFALNFAQQHRMVLQGSPLVYGLPATLPSWIKEFEQNQAWEPLRVAMKAQVSNVVGHYSGKVKSWIVINEAVDYDAEKNQWILAKNIWQKAFSQPGRHEATYIDEAFTAARAGDRSAVLIYNDFANAETNGKSDLIYTLLSSMKSRRIPVDAVGFQMHLSKDGADGWWLPGSIDIESFKKNMQRFADLGLDIYITELDMKLEDTSPQSLQRQAAIYSQIVQAAKTQPRFKGIMQWGLYDKYNWLNDLPTEKVKPLHPLIYDVNCKPKPAYFALKESLAK